ncbi:MAG TPA: CsbD family protein [Mycobacterium sp.]
MTDQRIDKAKGRVKEAAGALTGDEELKVEGRADQAKAAAKNAIDKAAEKLEVHKVAKK